MTAKSTVALELDDIQAGALEPRPVPYAGVYQILRLDDRHAGRELLRRLIPYLDSVASFDPRRRCRSPWHLASRDSKPSGYRRSHSPASRPSSSREWPHERPSLGTWGRTLPSTGRNHWVRRTAISWWSGSRPTLPAWRPLSATPATPHAICPASCPSGNRMCMPG